MARKMIDDYRAELYEIGKLRRMAGRLGPKRLAELRAELVGKTDVGGLGGVVSTEARCRAPSEAGASGVGPTAGCDANHSA